MTQDEIQAKIVEATLGGGILKCDRKSCRRKFTVYDSDSVLFRNLCPWCLRLDTIREYDRASSEENYRKNNGARLERLSRSVGELENIIKEQEWLEHVR